MARTSSHPLHVMPLKSTPSSSSSPSSSSMKLKTLIQTLVLSHVCRFIREISRASSILLRALRKKHYHHLLFYPKRTSKKQKKIFFGSFRLHYNWCSSHVVPVSVPVRLPDELYLAYDSTWNSVFSTHSRDNEVNLDEVFVDEEPPQLRGYLEWLEDKVKDGESTNGEEGNDIDKLADMFIASCHEKFMLEKVESLRRFQDMLARSV
ncbi:PREDICTED: uncharacterized protein LOC104826767 [Tarenaya hassleriana]|uniref:uncharacterized protein LOC104826767 n=1 Tax=Tarenaya hassleriana TaxID=28532 RepID=UPI00053C3A75|nr:PREDICTED: uncharacterized protein LOC104826767 [Tarenaya hassleriana]